MTVSVYTLECYTGRTAATGRLIVPDPHPAVRLLRVVLAASVEAKSVSNVAFPYVSQKKGGAIVNFGSLNLTSGSLFQGNVAASSSGDGGFGGGIYNGGDGSLW